MFTCVENESGEGPSALLASGQSVWTVSGKYFHLEPKLIPLNILVAVLSPVTVEVSDSAPLASWPGVEGLSGYDEGNYLMVLFLAWAYVLSARWAESLAHSPEHLCTKTYKSRGCQSSTEHNPQQKIELYLGSDISAEEAIWWNALLSPSRSWEITTEYNQRSCMSPWSVQLSDKVHISLAKHPSLENPELPSSDIALECLSRFCSRHCLHGQCSAALAAALYIPFLNGRSVTLPLPTPVLRAQSASTSQCAQVSDLISEHERLLSYYMTLSCNTWGMRSLLCSTFFDARVECNLVSAWINPAFVVIDPLVKEESFIMLAKVLAKHDPELASLWFGAILVRTARSILQNIRIGLTALELNASAWTRIEQSFITGKANISDGTMIRRGDECRLLLMTSNEEHARLPNTASRYGAFSTATLKLYRSFSESSVLGLVSEKWRYAQRRGHEHFCY